MSQTCEKTVTIVEPITGFAFSPTPITIKKGGCVTFSNTGFFTHSVHVDNAGTPGAEVVGDIKGGSSGNTAVLNETLNYICGIHPSMKGTITVQ